MMASLKFSIILILDEIKLYIAVTLKPIRPPMPQLLRPPEIFEVYFNITIL